MANQISVYSTVTQADQLLIDVPENGLLQTRYFPTESKDEFQTKEVLLDFDDGDLKAGAFVKKGYINGETVVWRGSAVEPPRIGIEDSIDPTDHDRLLFEQLMYAQGAESPSRADAFDDLKRVKAGREVKRVQRSIEKTCAQVFLDNGVSGSMPTSATDSTPVAIDVNYYSDAKGNDQRYIPQHAWGSEGANPYKDVVKMVSELVAHGGKAEDLLIAPQAWAILEQDKEFKDQFTMFHTQDSVLFAREIEGAQHVGMGNFGGYLLNIIVYYGQYKDASGAMTQYLPKDFVCVTAPRCGRTLCGGCTLLNPSTIGADDVVGVNSFVQKRGKYIVSQFMDLNAQQLAIRCESRPLPAPYSPWRWITMEAQNNNEIAGGVVAPDVNLDFVFKDANGSTIVPTTKPNNLAHVPGGSKIATAQVPDLVLSGYTFSKYILEDGSTWEKGSDGYTCPNISQTITGIMTQG